MSVKLHPAAISVVLGACLLLASCSSGGDSEPAPFSSSNAPSASPSQDANPDKVYEDKLKEISAAGGQYTFADLDGAEPQELLVKDAGGEIGAVKVFSVDGNTLIQADKTFQDGAASGGGARYGLTYLPDQKSLLESQGQAAHGSTSTTWKMENHQLVEAGSGQRSPTRAH